MFPSFLSPFLRLYIFLYIHMMYVRFCKTFSDMWSRLMVQLLNLVVHNLAAPALHSSAFAVCLIVLSSLTLHLHMDKSPYKKAIISLQRLFIHCLLLVNSVMSVGFFYHAGLLLPYMATRFLLGRTSFNSKVQLDLFPFLETSLYIILLNETKQGISFLLQQRLSSLHTPPKLLLNQRWKLMDG